MQAALGQDLVPLLEGPLVRGGAGRGGLSSGRRDAKKHVEKTFYSSHGHMPVRSGDSPGTFTGLPIISVFRRCATINSIWSKKSRHHTASCCRCARPSVPVPEGSQNVPSSVTICRCPRHRSDCQSSSAPKKSSASLGG